MPAKSRKQQRYLYARFGAAWVKRHHFNKLARSRKRKSSSRSRRRRRK